MPFFLIKGDITTLSTDAIVNAANTELKMGGGVCGSIFKAAGREQMEKACSALGPIKTGAAVYHPGFQSQGKVCHPYSRSCLQGRKERRGSRASCLLHKQSCTRKAAPV
jgi:O-acetyl-ADP-ribose deacetylase (regulator of RNase III)